jgi:transcriptional regulator with XRE-family HTH domain
MAPRKQTQERIHRVLPTLLIERGMSQRALARSIGINQSHISRVLAESPKLPPSRQLCGQIAEALDLPPDYFVEYREAAAIEAIKNDADLRERIYSGVKRRS